MRVLLLTPGAYGVNGGIALYNRDIAEAIAQIDGVSEVLVLPREIQREMGDLPAKIAVNSAAASGKGAFVRQSLSLLSQNFDLIVCGHINLMPLAVMMKARMHVPLALMVYGIDVWDRPNRLATFWSAKADAIWSISEITTQRMNAWADFPAHKYVQLPNAIHLARYGEAGARDEVRQKLGLADARIILTLARLPGFDRYKGVDEMLEIMPALLNHDPAIVYVVAGDGEDRARLEQKACDLGLSAHVRFLGYIEEGQKADLYRAADVFALPGRGEGFGFVFLEALACGVPCVGSSIDGSKEALRDGMLGEIPDPRDLKQVEEAVISALKVDRGIPDGLDYFAWPAFCARVSNAVDQLNPS